MKPVIFSLDTLEDIHHNCAKRYNKCGCEGCTFYREDPLNPCCLEGSPSEWDLDTIKHTLCVLVEQLEDLKKKRRKRRMRENKTNALQD